MSAGTFGYYSLMDRVSRYSLVDTEAGVQAGAARQGPPGQQYWRVIQYLFPFFVLIPNGVLGISIVNGTLVTERAVEPLDVHVQDGRSVALTAHGSASAPSADDVVDASGLHVFPGVVEPHAHIGLAGAPPPAPVRTPTTPCTWWRVPSSTSKLDRYVTELGVTFFEYFMSFYGDKGQYLGVSGAPSRPPSS